MKQKQNLILGAAIAGSLVLGLGLGRVFFSGASPAQHDDHAHATSPAAEATAKPTIWTCSMHPQIQQPDPGDCPICGMDLIPLVDDGGDDLGPRTMSMSESSRALAAIETSTVEQAFPEATVRIVGQLDYDETREKSLSARFPARIDRLYVNFTGIRVEQGEHLADVYSPDLLTAQRELLTAHRADPNSSIAAAAREKLRLWDLLPDQIDAVLESGTASDRFELRAPTSGVVVEKHVKEGDYVKTGEPLFRIVDLSVLWLNLEAYESDLPWLRYGQTVDFGVEAYPGEQFTGQIAFIEPELNRKTRTIPVRVNVPNPDSRLKPGMFARGEVKVRIAEGGRVYAPGLAGMWISPMHPEIIKDHPGSCDICGMDLVPAESLGFVDEAEGVAPIIVPSSAVLRTGKRAVVYVQVPNTERPTFEGREIVLGPRAGDRYIVEAGLEAGEEVVTRGAFKIDSALQIQAKPSMMNPEGGGPAPGHNHGGAPTTSNAHAGHLMALLIDPAVAQGVLPAYLDLQAALAADDLGAAKESLKAMMSTTGHSGPIPELIHRMVGAEDLGSLRTPHFEQLSMALIAAIEKDPTAFKDELLRMHCPMANEGKGADWIQSQEPLQNPYFGAMMLKCGEVRGILNESDSTNQEGATHAH
jgi:Cu(I)/Ag(I) efflux system membrane fusion protein